MDWRFLSSALLLPCNRAIPRASSWHVVSPGWLLLVLFMLLWNGGICLSHCKLSISDRISSRHYNTSTFCYWGFLSRAFLSLGLRYSSLWSIRSGCTLPRRGCWPSGFSLFSSRCGAGSRIFRAGITPGMRWRVTLSVCPGDCCPRMPYASTSISAFCR